MKIEIVNWWNAKIHSHKGAGLSPEKTIKELGEIDVCEILIDGKIVGSVKWDGKELTISKELVEVNRGKQK